MKKLLFLLAFMPMFSLGQSLGKKRVDRLRNAVVKIMTPYGSGTGFFISDKGYILTCRHVIEAALARDKDGKLIQDMPITVEFSDGEQIRASSFYKLDDSDLSTLSFDYFVIKIIGKPKHNIESLKLGSFDIQDGDEVYTCGYPFGMKEQFISKGIISTKYIQQYPIKYQAKDTIIYRKAAWLDLTMNKGNSGGPVVKLGKIYTDDEVVGIATFIQSPFLEKATNALETATNPAIDLRYGNGKTLSEILQTLSQALLSESYGISGCVSIDYFNTFYKESMR